MMRTKMTCILAAGLAVLALACAPHSARANAIAVTNMLLVNANTDNGTVDVQFDLSWSNSWRSVWDEGGASITNWDAAWVFIKYRETGGEWQHALLSDSGHTPTAGCAIDVGSSGSGTNVGAFVYRSSNGYGTLSAPDTRLRWNYGAAGLTTTNEIEVAVHAIEMVYVAEGSFYAGSGGTESGSFTDGSWGSGATIPLAITNELEITVTNAAGCLWGTSTSGNNTIGPAGVLSNAFPKGFSAFYCMKYEITQRQYVEFLNSLTYAQQVKRTAISPASAIGTYLHNANRHAIKISVPGVNPGTPAAYETDNPYVACNFLSWMDGAAYAQWLGLRPMTELEFEKACRGPVGPVADEYAWGTASINATKYTLADAGAAEESIATGYNDTGTAGNCNYSSTRPDAYQGPLRAGIFATSTSDRVRAGATYWGVMEMSGNAYERTVSVGLARGRVFEGTHGDGKLSAAGHATQSDWPGWVGGAVTGADGAGFRGGNWYYVAANARASGRIGAAFVGTARDLYFGWRAVRGAPSGVGP